MKRFVLLFVMLLSVASSISAQSTDEYEAGSAELYEKISSLIEDDLEGNKARIAELARGLTDFQKQSLITKYEKSAIGPFFLNLFLGYGIGSFIQRDKKSGIRQCIMQVAGLACVIAGGIIYINNKEDEYEETYHSGYWSGYYYNSGYYTEEKTKDNSGARTAGIILICTGIGLDLGGTISGCIAPWKFSNSYNNNLRNSVLATKVSVNFAPVIDPIGKNYGLIAKLSF